MPDTNYRLSLNILLYEKPTLEKDKWMYNQLKNDDFFSFFCYKHFLPTKDVVCSFNSLKIYFCSHARHHIYIKYAIYISAASEKIRSISKSEYFCHLRKNLFYFYLLDRPNKKHNKFKGIFCSEDCEKTQILMWSKCGARRWEGEQKNRPPIFPQILLGTLSPTIQLSTHFVQSTIHNLMSCGLAECNLNSLRLRHKQT